MAAASAKSASVASAKAAAAMTTAAVTTAATPVAAAVGKSRGSRQRHAEKQRCSDLELPFHRSPPKSLTLGVSGPYSGRQLIVVPSPFISLSLWDCIQ
jgi:hypothetical protein